MAPKQDRPRSLNDALYHDNRGQYTVPPKLRYLDLEARGGQGRPRQTRRPGPSNLTIPVPSPSDAAQANPSALKARTEPLSANQGSPRHPEDVHYGDLASPSRRPSESANPDQEAEIAAQVEQLRTKVGMGERWTAGDTLEDTAAHFRVYPSAVERYFDELALNDEDGKRKRQDAQLVKEGQSTHGE